PAYSHHYTLSLHDALPISMKFSMPCSDFSAPRLRYTSRMTARCMVLALLPIVPLAARAQSAPPDYAYVGAGVRTRPAYDGSAAQDRKSTRLNSSHEWISYA